MAAFQKVFIKLDKQAAKTEELMEEVSEIKRTICKTNVLVKLTAAKLEQILDSDSTQLNIKIKSDVELNDLEDRLNDEMFQRKLVIICFILYMTKKL